MHVHHTLTLFIVYFDVLVAVASLDGSDEGYDQLGLSQMGESKSWQTCLIDI